MYEQLRFEIRDGMIEIVNRYPSNMGAPGQPREPKRKKTPEEMARQNIRQREKSVQRLIAANFREGDFHLVLKYREAPDTYEEAKKDLQRFLASMRRAYKKAGYVFKYIGVTERGKKKSVLHHHLIIENIQAPELNTMQIVRKLWDGHCAWHDLYADGAYHNLAAYIVKKETKEESSGCSYTRSRNLRVPTPKKVIYKRKIWPAEPPARKGWYIAKGSVVDGVNPFTGAPYQTYLTMKVKEKEEPDYERKGSRCSTLTYTSRQKAASKRKTADTDGSSSTSRRRVRRKRVRGSARKRIQRRKGCRSWH